MAPRRADLSYRACGQHGTSKGFGDGMETGYGCHNQSATFSNSLLPGRTAWVFSISSKKNLLLSLLMSAQLYADRTTYSVLDKTILDQTAVSLAQMIECTYHIYMAILSFLIFSITTHFIRLSFC